MLTPNEFTVGSLADMQPLSLLLPRTKYECPMLVCGTSDQAIAVFLDKEYRFDSFPSVQGTNWKGIIIADVSIELDQTSVFDPEADNTPTGAVIREGTTLNLLAVGQDQYSIKRPLRVPLRNDLIPTAERFQAGFSKWHIFIGEGRNKRTLFQIDVATPPLRS